MVDFTISNLTSPPTAPYNQHENYAAALKELVNHMDWIETQNTLAGKESYFDRRTDALSDRIQLAKETFDLNDTDMKVITTFINSAINVCLQRITEESTIPYIDSPVIIAPNEAATLAQSVVVIGTIGFCAKEYAWSNQLIDGLRKEVQEIKREGKIPLFLSGNDIRGIGELVQQIASEENIPVIAMLTKQGLEQSSDATLIVPRDQVIVIENSTGRGDGWSTSTEVRGLEWISLLCDISDGKIFCGGGGPVGKRELLHAIELGVPVKYFDTLAGNLTSAAISQPAADNQRSLMQLLIATKKIFYSETDRCFINKAEGGNGEFLMRVPSYNETQTSLAPPVIGRSQSSQ